tara:strand:+ start:206 stop:499 length:294 start_codon:yes stop_codon:yes gene_type:complete
MIQQKLNVEVEITKVVNYLIKKHAWDFEFIKYSQLRKTIGHITKIKKIYFIRKIFLLMVDRQIFIKKQNKSVRSYLYKFKNPHNTITTEKEITIVFD